MSGYHHKFGINDVFHNQLKTHPQNEFFIWDSRVFYNNKSEITGAFTTNAGGVATGYLSLYEVNVDRNSTDTGIISPFMYKTANHKFSTMTDVDYNAVPASGTLTSTYNMSASIGRQYFVSGLAGGTSNYTGSALRNTFDHYQVLSPRYAYSSSAQSINKASDASCLMTVPSIFYGSSIKKGSVDLRFYITGTLIGRLQDINHNGELIQTAPAGSTGSGSCAGMTLYNEGFVYLSGSWSLDAATYTLDGGTSAPKWIHFGGGANDGVTTDVSASFNLAFSGTSYVPSVTMMAHAKKGELNHSNNWSYLSYDQTSSLEPLTGSKSYREQDLTIKNMASSAYADPVATFQKTTYISKIGIYDDDKNLIAIASLAKPIKKTEERDLTFKLKLDI